MRHSIAAAALSIVTVVIVAQQNRPANDAKGTIQLRAKVLTVSQLGDFSVNALPVDDDSRFALRMRIETVAPDTPELKPGSEVTFAIHSPALVFAGDPQNGKSYKFDLCRETVNGKIKFSRLGVRLKGGSIGGCG